MIGHAGSFRQRFVMGDENDRRLILGHFGPKKIHHLGRVLFVQIAGRFIAKEELGVADESPGESCSLLFPAGELAGQVMETWCQTQPVENPFCFLSGGFQLITGKPRWEKDVFEYIEVRQEIVELEEKTDGIETLSRPLRFGQGMASMTVNPDFASRWFFHETGNVKEGRLSRARGPHYGDGCALLQCEIDLAQDDEIAEAFGYIFQFKYRCHGLFLIYP